MYAFMAIAGASRGTVGRREWRKTCATAQGRQKCGPPPCLKLAAPLHQSCTAEMNEKGNFELSLGQEHTGMEAEVPGSDPGRKSSKK